MRSPPPTNAASRLGRYGGRPSSQHGSSSMAQFRRHSRQNVRVFNVDDAGELLFKAATAPPDRGTFARLTARSLL